MITLATKHLHLVRLFLLSNRQKQVAGGRSEQSHHWVSQTNARFLVPSLLLSNVEEGTEQENGDSF